MKRYGKFAALVVVIIGTLAWLAAEGVNQTKTYFKEIAELEAMPDKFDKRLRVGGYVVKDSIVRNGREVRFVVTEVDRQGERGKHTLNVVYNEADPLPDTFRNGSQALVDGRLRGDGVFQATKIQAKCASKYEAKPGGKTVSPAYSSAKAST